MNKIESVDDFVHDYFKELFFGKDHEMDSQEVEDFYYYKERILCYWMPNNKKYIDNYGLISFYFLNFTSEDVDKFQEVYFSETVKNQKLIRTAIKQAIDDVESPGYHDRSATLIILPKNWVQWFNNYPFKDYITEKYEYLEGSNPFTVSKEKGSMVYYIPYTITDDPKVPPMVLSDYGEYVIISF